MNWQQSWSQMKAVLGILAGSQAFGGPVQANLNLTNRCNLRCIHCFYNSPYAEKPALRSVRKAKLEHIEPPGHDEIRKIMNREADPDRTRSLMAELITMGTRRFQFSGMGEVFLNGNTLDFMRRAKRAGCYGVVNTNGTLLTREIIDELVSMRFDRLRITVMAGNAEMYRQTHPGANTGLFDTLRENLLYLSEKKKAAATRCPRIVLSYIVISLNHQGLWDFVRFARLVGADRVQFHPFDIVEDSSLANLALSAGQALSVRDQLAEVRSFLEAAKIDHNIANYLGASQEHLDTMALYQRMPCYYGWLAVRITVEGMVYPCCRCFYPLGNAYETGFRRIWEGESYRRFRGE